MTQSVSRRALLRGGCVTFATAVAGCSQGADGPPSAETTDEATADAAMNTLAFPFETPPSGECAVSDRPQPTPTADFEPRDYPQSPDSLTAASVEAYATAYERAYRHNSYLDTDADPDTQSLSVETSADGPLTEATTNGFLTGVDGELAVTQGDVVEDNPVVGLYYLTADTGLRADIERATLSAVESLRSVAVTDTRTVYCRDGADE